MTLAGILAALPITGGTLADHTFLFFGAGEVRIHSLIISSSSWYYLQSGSNILFVLTMPFACHAITYIAST